MFTTESHSGTAPYEIDEIGHARIAGTDYFFRFTNGDFEYATSIQGAVTNISPAAAISTVNQIWWAILDDKIWFVDGTNVLRFFDPQLSTTAIQSATVYLRPNPAFVPIVAGGGGPAQDYTFTAEKGYTNGVGYHIGSAESPRWGSAGGGLGGSTVTIDDEIYTGTTLAVGDRLRVYSKTAAVNTYQNVTPTSGAHANGVYETGADGGGYLRITSLAANYAIITVALNDDQPTLYSDLGVVLNKQAPTGLTGLTVHYGRLVAWDDDSVYNALGSNPFSWPDDAANQESFVYTIGEGDTEDVQRCFSFQESLYVFKQTQCFVFGGVGPDDTGNNAYSFRRIETNGIGCIAPKSVAIVGEESQNFLVFLSAQGFYATNGNEPHRIGENIETDIQAITSTVLSTSVAYYDKREGLYVCFVGTSGARKAYVLDTRKDEGVLTGWFKWADVNAKCVFYDVNRYLAGTYTGFCVSERQAQSSLDFKDAKVDYIDDTMVNTGTDVITVAAHGYATGKPIVIRPVGASVMPAPLVANTIYYVISVSTNTIRVATSEANALANIPIDITTTGTGDFSVVGYKAISAYYTTNWFNYGNPHHVKKLGKPGLSFNAAATSVNITVSLAYDWTESFIDSSVVAISGSHIWGVGPSWGAFTWASGAVATPRSVAIPFRKVRSIRYKFENNTLEENLDLQGIDMPFEMIRNRNNFAS